MSVDWQWLGNGLAAGAMTIGSAGSGDAAPTGFQGTGQTIITTGDRAPAILLTQPVGAQCAVYWTIASRTTFRWRGYFTLVGDVQENTTILARIGNGTTRALDFVLSAAGNFRLYDAANNQAASTAAGFAVANQKYRVDIEATSTTCTIHIFAEHSTIPLATLTATGAAGKFGGTFTRITLGNTSTSPQAGPIVWDDLVADNAVVPGPAVTITELIPQLKLSLDGVAAGALTTSTAGPGDTPVTALQGTGQTVVSDAPRTSAMKFTQTAGVACAAYWTFTSRGTLFYRDYFKLDAPFQTAASHVFFRIGAGTTRGIDFSLSTTGALRLFKADNTQVATTSAGAITTGVRYRREVTLTTTDVTVNIFIGESTTPAYTLTYTGAAGAFGTAFDRLYWGNSLTSTPAVEPLTIDNPVLDAYAIPVPLGNPRGGWQLGSIAMGY